MEQGAADAAGSMTPVAEIDPIPIVIVVLLSFIIERALAVFFDLTGLGSRLKWPPGDDPSQKGTSFKGLIAAAVSIVICWFSGLDVVNAILAGNVDSIPKWAGTTITGLVIAGGSQGSVKLFQDVLGFSKTNRDLINLTRKKQEEAKSAQADSDKLDAQVKQLQKSQELEALRARQAVMPTLVPLGGPELAPSPPLGALVSMPEQVTELLVQALPDPQERADFHLRRLKIRRERDERTSFLRQFGPQADDYVNVQSVDDLVTAMTEDRVPRV